MAANVSVLISLTDKISRPLRKISGGISNLANNGGLKKVSAATGRVTRNLGRLGLGAAGLAAGGLFAMKRMLIDTGAEFEKYNAVLTSIEGSSAGAKKSMDWITEFATKTPLELGGVMDSFIKLKNFGLDPMDGTMKSLVDANAKLGGSQQNLDGIVLAVGQAFSKQKLQGEEALQLIERGIPVWALLSKKLGKTTAELQEMSRKGELGTDAVVALVEAMGNDAIGASALQMKTWNGMMSNLNDQWVRFKLLIMGSGLFEFMKTNLKQVLDRINAMAKNGELIVLAKQIGGDLKDSIVGVVTAIKWMHSTLSIAAKAVGGFGNLFKTVMGGLALLIAGPLVTSVITLGTALVALAANPIVAIVVAVVAVGYALLNMRKFLPGTVQAFSLAFESIANLITGVKDNFLKGITAIFAGIRSLVSKLPGFIKNKLPKGFLDSTVTSRPAINSGASNRNTADVGGLITIQIDQEGQAKVKKLGPRNDNVPFVVNTGVAMAGAL